MKYARTFDSADRDLFADFDHDFDAYDQLSWLRGNPGGCLWLRCRARAAVAVGELACLMRIRSPRWHAQLEVLLFYVHLRRVTWGTAVH